MNSPRSVLHLNPNELELKQPPVSSLPMLTSNLRVATATRALPKTTDDATSTPFTTSSSSSAAQGQRLRNRYLHRIGIVEGERNPHSRIVPITLSVTPRSVTLKNEKPSSFSHPCCQPPQQLRRNSSLSSSSTTSTCSTSSSATTTTTTTTTSCLRRSGSSTDKKQKQVSFHDQPPTIHKIPSRPSYSRHVRQKLWISSSEMRQSYTRNVLEFRSENWDYRQCLEEDEFVHVGGRELIHPVHFCLAAQRQLLLQQQQQHYQCPLYGSPPKFSTATCASASQTINLKNHFCRVLSAQQRG